MKSKFDLEKWNKETRMKKLISAAMDKMDAEDLLVLMYEKCCNATQREYLRDKMADMLNFEGSIILRIDSMEKQDKVKQFLTTEIFPYYNEQQSQLFTC